MFRKPANVSGTVSSGALQKLRKLPVTTYLLTWLSNDTARLMSVKATAGCSGSRAFSRMANALL